MTVVSIIIIIYGFHKNSFHFIIHASSTNVHILVIDIFIIIIYFCLHILLFQLTIDISIFTINTYFINSI